MDSLPDEIIEMICGYLHVQDLLQMTLVNHKLRWIVENSPSLMEKVPLYLCDNDPGICNFDDGFYNKRLIELLLESNKKVRKVIVELKRDKIIKYIGVFEKFSDSIRILEIRNYAFDTLDQLRIILGYMYNLQKMTMKNVTFLKSENGFLNSIVQLPKYGNLKNLKVVNVINCDLRIFSLFINNEKTLLREIRLVLSANERDVAWRISLKLFAEALTHQHGLVKLSVDGINADLESVFDPIRYLSCKLRYLEILNCKMKQIESAENFIEMIKSQKHLKSLKIVKTSLPSSMDSLGVYRNLFAINNQIVETSLDINESSMLHSHNFTVGSIKKLTLRGNFAFGKNRDELKFKYVVCDMKHTTFILP